MIYRGKQAPALTMPYWPDVFTAGPACLAVSRKAMSGIQQGRWPELPLTEDAAAAIAALRLLWAKIATLPGMPATFTIPVIDGDPIPPGLRAVIATLTDLAASALLGRAEPAETETEAHVRDRVLSYLDTAIELATQQELARPGHALSLSPAAPVFRAVIACPECGTQRTLQGTEPEIVASAQMWQQGHRRAAHTGERGSAEPKNGEDLQLPDIR